MEQAIIAVPLVLLTLLAVGLLFRSLGVWGPHADDDDVYGGY